MVTERQKYLSGILRNIGFAMLAPVGSITFQWLVLKSGPYWGHFMQSMLVLFVGFLFLAIGYIVLKEDS